MKTEDQIQRAHDIIASVLLQPTPRQFEGQLRATVEALSWVLEHGDNQGFQTGLESIEQQLLAKKRIIQIINNQ